MVSACGGNELNNDAWTSGIGGVVGAASNGPYVRSVKDSFGFAKWTTRRATRARKRTQLRVKCSIIGVRNDVHRKCKETFSNN